MWSITYNRNNSFIVLATVNTIVNYNRKTFIVQAIGHLYELYFIEYSAHFFYMENDAEIFPADYTWKVAEKGFKMACVMNKLAMINSC